MLIRPSSQVDIYNFKPHKDDLNEALAAGHEPSFPNPQDCVSLVHEGTVLAIGGNHEDQVWFVTSHLVDSLTTSERSRFRKLIVAYRDIMLDSYPVLWNYVWIGNKSHIRFLKTIGAEFHKEYSMNGLFQLFTITK
ncbi:internal virion protein A [Pectobacterium phage Jarilo]|uniref:Internal virion protein A n=1 Tax=Pectobacterium phage Jarilo TaxID=2163634 RepID=A0A2S1GSZ6_9CAUD|nr:internal virion protein [Pectobacterium phage Jarilo]AWD92518.1 internal virion protein A [Pectobacterium phage Jarilo]